MKTTTETQNPVISASVASASEALLGQHGPTSPDQGEATQDFPGLDRLLRQVARMEAHASTTVSTSARTQTVPDIEALIDFAEGRLPEGAQSSLAQSLNADPSLRALLMFNKSGVLSDPDPYSAPQRELEKVFALIPETKRVWEVVVQRLRTGFSILRTGGELLNMQPLAVRGGERSPSTTSGEVYCIKRVLSPYTAQLIIQRKGEDRISLTLSLLDEQGAGVPELHVELWQGQRLRSALSSDEGAVTFTNVRSGAYQLVPRVGALELERLDFTMIE